jgi:hypothetical protein
MAVLMETSLGDLEIDLYVDECPSGSFQKGQKEGRRRR